MSLQTAPSQRERASRGRPRRRRRWWPVCAFSADSDQTCTPLAWIKAPPVTARKQRVTTLDDAADVSILRFVAHLNSRHDGCAHGFARLIATFGPSTRLERCGPRPEALSQGRGLPRLAERRRRIGSFPERRGPQPQGSGVSSPVAPFGAPPCSSRASFLHSRQATASFLDCSRQGFHLLPRAVGRFRPVCRSCSLVTFLFLRPVLPLMECRALRRNKPDPN